MVEPIIKRKKLSTFFIIYYNNVDYLAQQLDSWMQLAERDKIQFLIVDDGSANGNRAVDFLKNQSSLQLDIQVYEIDQDLVWNIGGARNLGFWVAPTEWVFLSDSDILVRPNTMAYVMKKLRDS